MKQTVHPSLYQINTRVWLTELSKDLGHRATLDDIPDAALDGIAKLGFDWVWFLSVWCTGELGRKVSLENQVFRREFEATLPDLCDEDIAGSGFAIAGYQVHPGLGGDEALERLRARLRQRGLKLMLDFVPNHMGPDHTWVQEHPEFFISGIRSDLEKYPQNYTCLKCTNGEMIFAYGRDPYFAGWPDTVQLNYSNPLFVKAMTDELLHIADHCDGVRCDMAMLILPDVFEKTWNHTAQPFWSNAIRTVREEFPDFIFMAEVYWDMEWTLQQQGFNYTYDKRLYDRLLDGHEELVRGHFYAEPEYQFKLARFLENHDEPRAASIFEQKKHEAAAIITFFSPGLRFFHQGQFEGRKKRISPHLIRAPQESTDIVIQKFYFSLLNIIGKSVFRNGHWSLLDCVSAWAGNDTNNSFLAFAWDETGDKRALVIVNYAAHASQCFVHLPLSGMDGKTVRFRDLMSVSVYDRDRDDLLSRGLYLDLPAWGYHVFEVSDLGKIEKLNDNRK
jgi:hypothetical protein